MVVVPLLRVFLVLSLCVLDCLLACLFSFILFDVFLMCLKWQSKSFFTTSNKQEEYDSMMQGHQPASPIYYTIYMLSLLHIHGYLCLTVPGVPCKRVDGTWIGVVKHLHNVQSILATVNEE